MYNSLYYDLNSAKNIFLCSHPNCPDAAGSLCGLIYLFKKLNKKYFAYLNEPLINWLKFMPGSAEIKNFLPDLNQFDTIVITDCSDLKHTGIASELLNLQKRKQSLIINLDHHLSNNYFGAVNLVNSEASSVCELIYEFFQTKKIAMPKTIAETLLAGILSDTDFFQNAATTSRAVNTACSLMRLGASPIKINKRIFTNKSTDCNILKLKGLIFSRLTINQKYQIAFTFILQKDLKKYQVKYLELEGLANFLNNLQGISIALLLAETENNELKISMRTTKDNIDLARLAHFLGGGGHKKAAGFSLPLKS